MIDKRFERLVPGNEAVAALADEKRAIAGLPKDGPE